MHIPNPQDKLKRISFYEQLQSLPLASASADFIATVLLIIFLFAIAIRPTITSITTLREQIKKLEKLSKDLTIKREALEKIAPQFQALQPSIPLIDKAMPDNPNFPTLEKEFRYLIKKNGMTLTSLSFSGFPVVESTETPSEEESQKKQTKKSISPNVSEVTFSLNVTATYDNLKNFIANLQNHIRINSISQISIQSAKRSQNGETDFLVRGSVYYYIK